MKGQIVLLSTFRPRSLSNMQFVKPLTTRMSSRREPYTNLNIEFIPTETTVLGQFALSNSTATAD